MKTALRVAGALLVWLMFAAVLFGGTYYLFCGEGVGQLSGIVRSWYNPCYGSETMGTHGRFQVPDLGIDVALYDGAKGKTAEIVDAGDSAVIWTPYGTSDGYIGDHCSENGGFCYLKYAVPNKTVAKIVYADGTEEQWICRHKYYDCTIKDDKRCIGTGQNPKEIYIGGIWTFTCLDSTGLNQIGIWWESIDN